MLLFKYLDITYFGIFIISSTNLPNKSLLNSKRLNGYRYGIWVMECALPCIYINIWLIIRPQRSYFLWNEKEGVFWSMGISSIFPFTLEGSYGSGTPHKRKRRNAQMLLKVKHEAFTKLATSCNSWNLFQSNWKK